MFIQEEQKTREIQQETSEEAIDMHIRRNGKFYKCKGCRRALYCSRKCQKQDWNLNGHKYRCTLSMCLHQSKREWKRMIRQSKCYS